MYGNTIVINGKVAGKRGDICYHNIVCHNQMNKKFEHDKIFAETNDYILLLDGVILNRKELCNREQPDDADQIWQQVLLNMYENKGEQFFSELRGSFAGALYDKEKNKWIIFSDQLGSKFVYYSQVGDFFCSTQVMGNIYELLSENGIEYHLDELGAWMLLTYGYMLDNYTLCSEVRKINPGCYITLQNGKVEEHRYYLLCNTPDSKIFEQDAVEIVDNYFRQAVTRQFEKDNEYGYKHLVALSGGLDCRMTSFVAHDCGYTNQLNMTFSQTNYWDQTLPMKMSSDLKHEWIFKSLDNGRWLYDVDEITLTTGGNVLYYGTAHGNSILKYLNFDNLGLIHSGQIGDVVIGSFILATDKNIKYSKGGKAYSTKYLDFLKDYKLLLDVDKEIGSFYYRAFNGTNNGLQNSYNYSETLSPFLDLDMLEKALTIPVELRQNHDLYKKWILRKYPQAAKYEWETTGQKIDVPVFKIGCREIPIANIPHSLMVHIKHYLGIKESADNLKSMNPIAYYLAHNQDLYLYLEGYFKYVNFIENTELRHTVQQILHEGTSMEKIQAVSLLAAIKLFYS